MSSTTKSGEADVPLLPRPDRQLLRRTLPNLHVGGAGTAYHVASRRYRPLLEFVSSAPPFRMKFGTLPLYSREGQSAAVLLEIGMGSEVNGGSHAH